MPGMAAVVVGRGGHPPVRKALGPIGLSLQVVAMTRRAVARVHERTRFDPPGVVQIRGRTRSPEREDDGGSDDRAESHTEPETAVKTRHRAHLRNPVENAAFSRDGFRAAQPDQISILVPSSIT